MKTSRKKKPVSAARRRAQEIDLWKAGLEAKLTAEAWEAVHLVVGKLTADDVRESVVRRATMRTDELVRSVNFTAIVNGLVAAAISDALIRMNFEGHALGENIRRKMVEILRGE